MRGSPTRPRAARNGSGDGSDKAIRERIAAGADPRALLPPRVAEYVERHRLYGGGA